VIVQGRSDRAREAAEIQEPEHFPDSLSFVPPCVRTGATKLLREKEE
jgi:hypothetical protein